MMTFLSSMIMPLLVYILELCELFTISDSPRDHAGEERRVVFHTFEPSQGLGLFTGNRPCATVGHVTDNF